MDNLRKAAEMALDALLKYPMTEGIAIQALRQALEQPRQECETCANKRSRLEQAGFLKSPLRGEEKQFFYGQDPNVLPAPDKGEINDK